MQYDDKSIDKQVQEINSKHCIPILLIIYENEGITQGDLALRLELLPSGLNAVVKKMERCNIPLVEVTQIGKYKKYSLPEYMKRYLINLKKEKKDSLKQRQEDNLFLLLQRFVDEAGEDWKEIMNFLLLKEEIDFSTGIEKKFFDFINLLKKKTINCDEGVLEIRAFIRNEVLLYLIDKYIEAAL